MNAIRISAMLLYALNASPMNAADDFGSIGHKPTDTEGICIMTGISAFINGYASNLGPADSMDKVATHNIIGGALTATAITALRYFGSRRNHVTSDIAHETTIFRKLASHQAEIALTCYSAGAACGWYTSAMLNLLSPANGADHLSDTTCICPYNQHI